MEDAVPYLNIATAGLSLISGIMGVQAQREDARATASALREESRFNLSVLRQQKTDQMWADTMSLWRSGLSTKGGTSAAGVIANNQNVLQNTINHQERMYGIKIANADAAADRRFLGIF